MEWTDQATRELETLLAQLHCSLESQDVDADEVTADIRARLEEELNAGRGHLISAEQVLAAARKIGVQDLIRTEPPSDPDTDKLLHALEKPQRVRKNTGIAWFWFAGIILPLITLTTELITHICLETGFFDPIPNPICAVLIALVPLACFLGRRTLTNRPSLPDRWFGLLLGAATGIAIFYALLFAILTPFAIMGFALIFHFGIGLLSFIPLSPLLSMISLLRLRVLIKRKSPLALQRYRRGLIAGLTLTLLAFLPTYVTKAGLVMANSQTPATQQRGIQMLRSVGDDIQLNRACYNSAPYSDPISLLVSWGRTVQPNQARDIYYRVTGTPFNTVAAPTLGLRNRRNPGDEFDWDPEQGGDVVAGRLKGLSLRDSRIDGIVDPDAATAYLEWTMVFHNDWSSEREARAQIALPPGAAVSRLTLWIDGEEREAAFGGRSQVKQAYKKVVRRRRDPVLVTTYGPDRVLMQCYPVPAGGDMKIRIGITAPMDCLSQLDRSLKLPTLMERNFRIPNQLKHAIWIEDFMTADLTDQQLNSTTACITATASSPTSWAADDTFTIKQEILPVPREQPEQIAIVLDTSIGMKPCIDEVIAAIRTLPDTLPVSIWLANDGDPTAIQRDSLSNIRIAGGKDNAPALRKALMESGDCVVWIHAPQAWDLGSSEMLRQALERGHSKKIFDVQVATGPNRLVEKMNNLSNYRTVPRCDSVQTDLGGLFRSFTDDSNVWMPIRTESAPDQISSTSPRANNHLIRLYALDQIRADLSNGTPGNDTATKLAMQYHLVTPISGAVVLETQKQYEENDLHPVDSKFVPSIPEPNTISLLLLAVFLIIYGKRIIELIKTKLELAM